MQKTILVFGVLVLGIIGVVLVVQQRKQQPVQQAVVITNTPLPDSNPIPSAVPIQLESHLPFPMLQTKTSNCVTEDNLPDSGCSPGAIVQATKEAVCKPGYPKSLPTPSQKIKSQVFAAYGISAKDAQLYVLDHVISVELGGSNESANLWPQSTTNPGAHEKDLVETYLHKQVCAGTISLQDAQKALATSWLQELQATQE